MIECISSFFFVFFFIALIECVDSHNKAAKVSLRAQKWLKTRLRIEGGSNLRPNVIENLMRLAISAQGVQEMCKFRIAFSILGVEQK